VILPEATAYRKSSSPTRAFLPARERVIHCVGGLLGFSELHPTRVRILIERARCKPSGLARLLRCDDFKFRRAGEQRFLQRINFCLPVGVTQPAKSEASSLRATEIGAARRRGRLFPNVNDGAEKLAR